MDVEYALEQAGLSQQEAQVYLNTLKLGAGKASEIAQKCSMQRGGAYYCLKLLKEKGFVAETIRSGVKHYSATSPVRILELIKEEAQRKEGIVKEIIPELSALRSVALERPSVEVYEGIGGFKTVTSRLLDEGGTEFRCMLSPHILDFLPHFHQQFRRRRKNRGIKIRTITEKTPELNKIKKLDKKELRETRYAKKLFSDAEIMQYILEDSVVIIRANQKEQVCVWIKEKSFANLQKNLFERIWSSLGSQ